MTPPDAVSAENDAEFATIPFEFPFAKLMQIIKDAVRENLPLAQAIEELRRARPSRSAALHRRPRLHRRLAARSRVWTPQQEQALAKIINIDQTRRIWMGSLEITELIRRRLAHEMSPRSARVSACPLRRFQSVPARSAAMANGRKASGSTSTPN